MSFFLVLLLFLLFYGKIKGMSNVVLESLLRPLEEFYKPSFVEEIAINQLIDCDIKVGRTPCYPADMNDYKKKNI